MFGTLIETGIGLALVFLFMSLIATALRELIENWFQTRSTNLERGVRQILGNRRELVEAFYGHPMIVALYEGTYRHTPQGGRVTLDGKPGNLPSYIPRQSFALAVLDVAASTLDNGRALSLAELEAALRKTEPRNEVQEVVLTMLNAVGGDMDRLRKTLEEWFDGTMDRVSGWYTRTSGRWMLGIGLGAAIVFNVDAFAIADKLLRDETLRAAVVAQAESVRARGIADLPGAGAPAAPGDAGTAADAPVGADLGALSGALQDLGLPLGWRWSTTPGPVPYPQFCPSRAASKGGDTGTDDCQKAGSLFLMPFGWVITALAIMLGGPFWFDVLNKFMVVRSTVKPKEKSPDERSADR
ncbi:hypothetical protein [Mangrovibrevibacter kandeliae]|uniref:hypothetical protein n=1 Tax=Mangrovibrevibacter kandeliae TaxID=2968473 RepID=UPI00211744DA|nr:hypothetical protein [Aurantimonas sp. CSK15Z-1]MCQ8783133.1 hypothetical protein [Aurantimonas sp. CSK15Z-1]